LIAVGSIYRHCGKLRILRNFCGMTCGVEMNVGAFLMCGLEKVRAEFSLTALVYNLRRALNIVGVEGLLAAVAG
jgi:hypothetical protein